MSQRSHPLFIYQSVLEPWVRLATGAPTVVALRISLLPLLWFTDPVKAAREVECMFVEKHDAWQETAQALLELPMHYSAEIWAACLRGQPHLAWSTALINGSQRIAKPTDSRIRANRKRLASPK